MSRECEWLLFISNCHKLTGHELQFEINSNHLHTHVTWTTIRDKQQSLTHSRDMNYNSTLTAITHTLTGHELQFCCLSRIVVHVAWVCELLLLSRIVVHVPWVCEWFLFISNCSSCPVQFEINSNNSHTHATWTKIRYKQESLTQSRDMNYNSR
jgi:hypothetical protein